MNKSLGMTFLYLKPVFKGEFRMVFKFQFNPVDSRANFTIAKTASHQNYFNLAYTKEHIFLHRPFDSLSLKFQKFFLCLKPIFLLTYYFSNAM